jgi:hypothetical protein
MYELSVILCTALYSTVTKQNCFILFENFLSNFISHRMSLNFQKSTNPTAFVQQLHNNYYKKMDSIN